VDANILQGTIEPRDMLVELEQLVAEAASYVIDAFAAGEASVKDRDLGLARGYKVAVDVAKSLFHRACSTVFMPTIASVRANEVHPEVGGWSRVAQTDGDHFCLSTESGVIADMVAPVLRTISGHYHSITLSAGFFKPSRTRPI